MKPNIIVEKSSVFAVRIVNLTRYLKKHKVEARETNFWLKVLFNTKTISERQYASIAQDCSELEKILFAIMKTTRINEEGKNSK